MRNHGGVTDEYDPLCPNKCISQGSPVSGYHLQSNGSSSSSFSSWFSSSDDDGSLTPPSPFDVIRFPKTTQDSRGLWLDSKSIDDSNFGNNAALHNLGKKMSRMGITDQLEVSPMVRQFPHDFYGFSVNDSSSIRTNRDNVQRNGVFQNCRNVVFEPVRPNGPFPMNPLHFNREGSSSLLGLQQEYQIATQQVYCVDPNGCQPKHTSNDSLLSNFQHNVDGAFGGYCHGRKVQGPQQYSMDFIRQPDEYNGYGSLHMMLPSVSLGMERSPCYDIPKIDAAGGAAKNGLMPQSLPSRRVVWDLEAVHSEESLLIQGNNLNYVINNKCDFSTESSEIVTSHLQNRRLKLDGQYCSRGVPFVNRELGNDPKICSPMFLLPKYNSLLDLQGQIYYMSKNQHGCWFLQQKFDEGTPQDVQMMFQEITSPLRELMMNPFGNYLVQKLLGVCNEEQRMQILLLVTNEPGELIRISLNMHGMRAVQKLFRTLKTLPQISLVVSALKPGFLDLVMDLNGNHVIQHCLKCLSNEDNKIQNDMAYK